MYVLIIIKAYNILLLTSVSIVSISQPHKTTAMLKTIKIEMIL